MGWNLAQIAYSRYVRRPLKFTGGAADPLNESAG